MILDFLFFPLFLFAIYLLGFGVLAAARCIKWSDTELYPLYGIFTLGLVSIGVTSLLVNFITGVDSPLTYGTLTMLALAGLWHAFTHRFPHWRIALSAGLIFSVFAAIIPPGADTGLYHLPHQLWIRSEPIVFGLAHMHSRFAFSSFFEYIAAPLWVNEHFKLLAYLSATFPILFLCYLYDHIRSQALHRFIPAALVAGSLIIYNGYIYYDYTSTDIPTAVFFAIAFLSGLQLLLDKSKPSAAQLTLFFLCAALGFMFKTSGILIALWVGYVLICLWRAQYINLRILRIPAIITILLLTLWTVRGVIISGCLAFPVSQTCLPLPWAAEQSAINNSKAVLAWARHPATGWSSLESWDWFTAWWWPNQAGFVKVMIRTTFITLAIYMLFFARGHTRRWPHLTAACAFILISILAWFLKMPTVRFGFGNFILMPAAIAIAIGGLRSYRPNLPYARMGKGVFALLVLKWAFIAPHIESATSSEFETFPAPHVPTTPDAHFGVDPANADFSCWTVKHCSLEGNPTPQTIGGYLFFIPKP